MCNYLAVMVWNEFYDDFDRNSNSEYQSTTIEFNTKCNENLSKIIAVEMWFPEIKNDYRINCHKLW